MIHLNFKYVIFLPMNIYCHMCCLLDILVLLSLFQVISREDQDEVQDFLLNIVSRNVQLTVLIVTIFLCNCFSTCIGVLTWNLPKGEIVRFLVCLGMYSILKRCCLVMFSGLRIEDSSRQKKTWPQLMQDVGFKEKCASSVDKCI